MTPYPTQLPFSLIFVPGNQTLRKGPARILVLVISLLCFLCTFCLKLFFKEVIFCLFGSYLQIIVPFPDFVSTETFCFIVER